MRALSGGRALPATEAAVSRQEGQGGGATVTGVESGSDGVESADNGGGVRGQDIDLEEPKVYA